ncbi:hypothetical protein [Agrobacterium sp. ICMP 6402]|uniref:hypothetical protein n=1 Tax=Agrobacterium sp. ICMP 6402 TaxID=2292443 RepID=UPI0018860463|nr:hypothetical protein [Agrobacterium sp. ICMP 6402]
MMERRFVAEVHADFIEKLEAGEIDTQQKQSVHYESKGNARIMRQFGASGSGLLRDQSLHQRDRYEEGTSG